MRILLKNLRHGKIKLAAESLDDLWHLQHVVEPGDIITSSTWRRERRKSDKTRPERLEKRRVILSLKVEKAEFYKHANLLKILGTIVDGEDIGKHHSFNLGPGSVITVTKKWKPHLIRRIQNAVRSSRKPRVLLVVLDDSSAELALVRQYGLEELGTIFFHGRGKRYPVESSGEEEFFSKLAKAINDVIARSGVQKSIVAGPGFTKERFAEFLRDKFLELHQKIEIDSVSSGGRAGLYEVVRRGTVERVSKYDRLSYETLLVERLMGEIAKSGLATYGKDEIRRAASLGSIKKLLVADKLLRSGQVETVLEEVRKTKGDVVIISTEHDAGKQLLALGGLGALLRFRI